jgi:hypothetical protein
MMEDSSEGSIEMADVGPLSDFEDRESPEGPSSVASQLMVGGKSNLLHRPHRS